ncbi:MAG: divalent-cation tolerance protein CutA [Myxococcales bacterium]|nr:divalent-cation tolerance protein CutA [Myxococcales bacterium]
MSEHVVALSTVASAEQAEVLARALVEERLAACVNVVPGVRSFYRWRGELAVDGEVLCVIKTRRDRVEALRARLVALHPYELPELVVLDVVAGHEPYLAWLDESVE